MKDNVIDFKQAKVEYQVKVAIKKLRKVYNDIDISYYYIAEGMVLKLSKSVYNKEILILYIELENMIPESIFKYYINRFIEAVYQKRELET